MVVFVFVFLVVLLLLLRVMISFCLCVISCLCSIGGNGLCGDWMCRLLFCMVSCVFSWWSCFSRFGMIVIVGF